VFSSNAVLPHAIQITRATRTAAATARNMNFFFFAVMVTSYYLIKNTVIAQANTKTAQPRLKYAVLRLVFHCVYVWHSRLTPINGTHRLIACVHISNICNIANVTTARLTITENTVIILCDGGESFHFVFMAHSPDLVQNNRVFLALLISRIFHDSDHKIEVDSFGLTVLFHQDCSVSYFLNDAFILVIAVKGRNDALFINKSLCKLFHFGISLQFSSLDDLPCDDSPSIAEQNVKDDNQHDD
jgi:hypothetical protein